MAWFESCIFVCHVSGTQQNKGVPAELRQTIIRMPWSDRVKIALNRGLWTNRSQFNKCHCIDLAYCVIYASKCYVSYDIGLRVLKRRNLRGFVNKIDEAMSDLKCSILIELMRRKEWKDGGERGEGVMSREEKVGMWSEGKPKDWEIAGDSLESEEVMRSRVLCGTCMCRRVGTEMCWVRFKEERRLRNCLVLGSRRLFTGILKSPVKRYSWGVVRAEDRKVWNWSRKTEKGWEFEESGGW
jgi:hypothetical protein